MAFDEASRRGIELIADARVGDVEVIGTSGLDFSAVQQEALVS